MMDNKYQDWLGSLKAGDEVAIKGQFIDIVVTKITKITPKRQMRVE